MRDGLKCVDEKKEEIDGFKRPQTMDEIMEGKLNPLIDSINQHVERIYLDFNTALHKQLQNMDRAEQSISHMVQVLWGIVNKANARTAALERVLLKNGLDQDELEAEILLVIKELKATGQWQELELEGIAEKVGIDIPEGELPTPKNPAPL